MWTNKRQTVLSSVCVIFLLINLVTHRSLFYTADHSIDYHIASTNKWNNNNSNTWTNNCGVLWFYHIPKTGGSNFQYLMQQKLEQRYGKNVDKSSYIFQFWTLKFTSNNSYDATFELTNKLVPFIRNKLPTKTILFVHHHIWALSFTELVTRKGINLNYIKHIVINEMGCGFLFVTLIREPVSQTLSHIAYLWKIHPEMKKRENTTQNALQKICLHNYQLTFLNYAVCPRNSSITSETLYNTIKLMEHFDIIGIFETYNQFVLKILQIMNFNIAENEFEQSLYQKRLGHLTNKEKITNIDIQTLNDIIKANTYDFPLYYHFYHKH